MMMNALYTLLPFVLACPLITAAAAPMAESDETDTRPPYRALFIGDSITKHGPAPQLKWALDAGMAASTPDNDYVHRLSRSLQEALPNRRVECHYAQQGGNTVAGRLKGMDQYHALRPHLVVVQLGEHEHPEQGIAALEESYTRLLDGLLAIDSKPLVICTGRWAPNRGEPYDGWLKQTDTTMQRIADERGVPFVPVEDIATDPRYSGYGESPGVRWHPNDLGMEQYASRIFAAWEQAVDVSRLDVAQPEETPTSAHAATRRRGFTVSNLKPDLVRDAARDWNANLLRYMIRPQFRAERENITVAEAWRRILEELPEQLDAAATEGVTVVLALFELPNENTANYPTDRKARQAAFWNDRDNLQLLIACWEDIARISRDREQELWFDLLNEPLDWNDMPNSPKRWPEWAQQTIDAIRAIDSHHPIVIEPGPGGLCWGFRDFPKLRGEPIIYSVHQYQPHQYTHQGVSDIRQTDLARTYLERQRGWPGEFGDSGGGLWNAQRLRQELQPAIDYQRKHGVRMYVGEFSTIKWAPDAAAYLEDSIALFEALGSDWTYHAFREWPGWSLEHTDDFDHPTDAQRASAPTQRAMVVKRYLDRNERRSHRSK